MIAATVELTPAESRVLDAFSDWAGLAERRPFHGWQVVAVQHVQRSLLGLVDAVVRGGACPDDITVLGKSYSTNPAVLEALSGRGVRADDPIAMAQPQVSYEAELAGRVAAALDTLAGRPLLVLDEGGVARRAIAAAPHRWPQVRVVEQTARGVRGAGMRHLTFPVIDVARSWAKSHEEAPLIARSMHEGLMRAVADLGRRLDGWDVALVGYGVVGAALTDRLTRAGHRVTIVESEPARQDRAREAELVVAPFAEAVENQDIVIGCTGTPLFSLETAPRLAPGALLVNGGSSDIEYAVWEARTGPDRRPWQRHYPLPTGADVTLVAGGFPINFYGAVEPIPASDFQITRGLMLAGAVQVAESGREAGIRPLRDDLQRHIVRAYRDRI
ncbi:NAD(P)-binding domain-containing protein [Actinoplanes sp. NPDC051475]|uniref:NAD(P)-binding domain-containing protein n=1 Tax=Actinoplanes sp. NPDC051475 TaxID=3157225 RepID=UPI00344CC91B